MLSFKNIYANIKQIQGFSVYMSLTQKVTDLKQSIEKFLFKDNFSEIQL